MRLPVTRLNGLLDLPSRLIFDRRAGAERNEGHLIFISNCDCGNVHKVVHFRNELVALPLCLTVVIPQFSKRPAGMQIWNAERCPLQP